MTNVPTSPAKRGDLAAVVKQTSVTYASPGGASPTRYEDVRPVIVTSVFRDGKVKEGRAKNGTRAYISSRDANGNTKVLIVPREKLNGHEPERIMEQLEEYYDSTRELQTAILEIIQ